jgi:hypothetical protein
VARLHALLARSEHQLGRPGVPDPGAVAAEDVEDRQLRALGRLGVVVAVVGVVARGEQPQAAPPALLREGPDPLGRRLRDDDEVDAPGQVVSRAVERVEDRRARRARGLLQRQLRGLADGRPGPRVAGVAREHEAVDDERVRPGREQLGEAHFAAVVGRLEDVVVGHRPARRQRPALRGDALDRPAQLHLGLEQAVALAAVLGRLAREAEVVGHVA